MRPLNETAPRHRRPADGRPRHRSAAALPVATLVVVTCLIGAVVLATEPRTLPGERGRDADAGLAAPVVRPEVSEAAGPVEGPATPTSTARARGRVVRAAAVLRAWDRRRAEAWAAGDPVALRELYVDGAGVGDVRLLRRWTARGYRVAGLTTQLLAVEVLDRTPGRWRLEVTDRVAGGTAVGAGGRLPLPRDSADSRVVVLVRADGAWRVAQVRRVSG